MKGVVALFRQFGKDVRTITDFNSKSKYTVYIRPEVIQKADMFYKYEGSQSRSEFIENAIIFYAGYIASNYSFDYYPQLITTAVKGTIDNFENRMASLMFKNSVELSMMMNIIAANFGIDDSILDRLRGKCVKDVKRTHGNISFDEVLRYQRGED